MLVGDSAPLSRSKAIVAELRDVLAGLREVRRLLPRDKVWKAVDYTNEDDISAAEQNVKSAITVAKHKTPNRELIAQRLEWAREFLARVVGRQPAVMPFMEQLNRLIDEAIAP